MSSVSDVAGRRVGPGSAKADSNFCQLLAENTRKGQQLITLIMQYLAGLMDRGY